MKMILFLLSFTIIFISVSLSQTKSERTGTFKDSRDGAVYRWVRIGHQLWMAENLRFKTDSGSWCWKNVETNVRDRGRLYSWHAAMQAPPTGWHLPSDDEWKDLEMTLGLTKTQADQEGFRIDHDSLIAGKMKLKGKWPTEYKGKRIIVSNESGFSAIETGHYANNRFDHEGYTGWWTSDGNEKYAWLRHVGFFDNTISRIQNRKEFAFPVRCIKDKE